MEKITNQEKAALYLHIIENYNDWQELFKISGRSKKANEMKPTVLAVTASRWKNSEPVQNAIRIMRMDLEDRKKAIEQKAIQEENTRRKTEAGELVGPSGVNEEINFLDPDQFLQFANQQANQITDEKERRAYLEMIAKLMNYKDKDEAEQEQIRAYLPIVCDSCELRRRCESCKLDICPVEV